MEDQLETIVTESEILRLSCVSKLRPERLNTSGKFTAILAYLLGEEWTDPVIESLAITKDGAVVAWDRRGDSIVGDATALMRNLRGVSGAAGLTEPEAEYLRSRVPRQGALA